MKKIIIVMILLGLVGCEDSSQLENVCTKEERAGSLVHKTIYTITFKNDIIENIAITYDYQDSNASTISSIKLSTESRNQFLNEIEKEVMIDTNNQYQITYHLNNQTNDEMKQQFHYQEKRSKLIQQLKEEGYICE